jgi:phosphate:Na+ symporter
VANTLLFIPFIGIMARAIERLLPEKGTKEEVRRLTFLDTRTVDSPSLGIIQSRKQIQVMAEATEKVFGYLETVIEHPEGVPDLEEKIFRREEILDQMQKEVVVFLGHLLTGEVPHDVTEEARGQIRMADEYESLSDYQASVLKGLVKLRKNQLRVSDEGMEDLRRLHAAVAAYVATINQGVRSGNRGILTRARADGDYITRMMKEIRKRHLQRLSDEIVPALKSLIYMDILNHYRRMKDHAFNVAEVLAGEK